MTPEECSIKGITGCKLKCGICPYLAKTPQRSTIRSKEAFDQVVDNLPNTKEGILLKNILKSKPVESEKCTNCSYRKMRGVCEQCHNLCLFMDKIKPETKEINYLPDGQIKRRWTPNWLKTVQEFNQVAEITRTVESLVTDRECMVDYIEALHDELDIINMNHVNLIKSNKKLIDAHASLIENIDESGMFIRLNVSEIQSKRNRVAGAEDLIKQLPKGHDGRNSWLLNYGRSREAMDLRDNNESPLGWDSTTNSACLIGRNISEKKVFEKESENNLPEQCIVCPFVHVGVCNACCVYDKRKERKCSTCKWRTGILPRVCETCMDGSKFHSESIPESNNYEEGN